MVAGPLSIDHLCEQKLLQSLAVSKHAGVLELRSEGGNCTALGHSNLKNAQNYTKTSMVDCRDVYTLNMYVCEHAFGEVGLDKYAMLLERPTRIHS